MISLYWRSMEYFCSVVSFLLGGSLHHACNIYVCCFGPSGLDTRRAICKVSMFGRYSMHPALTGGLIWGKETGNDRTLTCALTVSRKVPVFKPKMLRGGRVKGTRSMAEYLQRDANSVCSSGHRSPSQAVGHSHHRWKGMPL